MYYMMLHYYLKLFDSGKREFAFHAETLQEYTAWILN